VRQEDTPFVSIWGPFTDWGISLMGEHVAAGRERRDTSPVGRLRRTRFAQSLEVLRALGLPGWVVRRYTRAARAAARFPHEIVSCAAEHVAAEMLETSPENDLSQAPISGTAQPAGEASAEVHSKQAPPRGTEPIRRGLGDRAE
jgi:hypothetical protein